MKARLLAPPDWESHGSQVLRVWPSNRAIPDGWEEIELTGAFQGTHLRDVSQPSLGPSLELCQCGHDRRSHTEHRNRCLVRRDFANCDCLRFREAE